MMTSIGHFAQQAIVGFEKKKKYKYSYKYRARKSRAGKTAAERAANALRVRKWRLKKFGPSTGKKGDGIGKS